MGFESIERGLVRLVAFKRLYTSEQMLNVFIMSSLQCLYRSLTNRSLFCDSVCDCSVSFCLIVVILHHFRQIHSNRVSFRRIENEFAVNQACSCNSYIAEPYSRVDLRYSPASRVLQYECCSSVLKFD